MVDGWNPASQLRLVAYPIIYTVLYTPDGAGILPSKYCTFIIPVTKHDAVEIDNSMDMIFQGVVGIAGVTYYIHFQFQGCIFYTPPTKIEKKKKKTASLALDMGCFKHDPASFSWSRTM